MKPRLVSIVKYTVVFILGFILGVFLLETLEMYLRPAYRDLIIRSHLKAEQEFSASRAERENRPLDVVFHRWAVVNTEADNGFRVLRPLENEIDGPPYLYPFSMLGLKWMFSGMFSDEKYKIGLKISEGIDRGKLAAALDALGQKKEAKIQWFHAQKLMHYATIKDTKKFIYSMLQQEKSDLHLKAEEKVLGKKRE